MTEEMNTVPRLHPERATLTMTFQGAGPDGQDVTIQFGPMHPVVWDMLRRTLKAYPVKVTQLGPPAQGVSYDPHSR